MRLDLEVRSSGPGPRHRWHGSSSHWAFAWIWTASRIITRNWTRYGLDHKGRTKRPCDGVAIIIRVAE